MDELRKQAKKKVKFLLILCGIFGAGLIGTLLLKNEVIVYLGIGAFKVIRVGLIGATAAAGIASGVSGIRSAARIQGLVTSYKEQQKAIEEGERRAAGRLSVKDKLDNAYLRDLLKNHMYNEWRALEGSIQSCIGQLEQMDDYQERLSRLLKNNAAEMLRDTEDVLDRVEQYICRNVRKVLNYMEVADPKAADDAALLESKLSACCSDNQEQLRQTQEFIFALTDFLNQQGDSENDVSMLELYKKTILDSIKDD